MWWFAWVYGPKGPAPVKFDSDIISPMNVLINYRLNADEKEMSLDTLAKRYPYKPNPEGWQEADGVQLPPITWA